MTRPPHETDLIYDRLIAQEKLKSGSKYERLAALVFAQLVGRAVVHDLRLRGASADIAPDEAYVVSTVGFTRDAKAYAAAKGIKLAALRAVRPPDMEGLVQRVAVTMVPLGFAFLHTGWVVDPTDPGLDEAAARPGEMTSTLDASLITPAGARRTLNNFPIHGIDLREAYEGDPGVRLGEHEFAEPHTLVYPDGAQVRVLGLRWKGMLSKGEHTFSVGYGVGGMIAELALLTVTGEVVAVFSNRQIAQSRFMQDGAVTRDA